MAATLALFRKELRQHGPALVGVTALLAVTVFGAYLALIKEARVLSVLELVPQFALTTLIAAALYLGHRIVVAEYYGRTQRFVESLPVRRGLMVLVKAAFGLGWMLLWAGAVLLLAARAARATEPVEPRFLAIMAARLGLYTFAVWGLAFVYGFFGRLRIPLALGAAFLLFLLNRTTTLELGLFGPLGLVDHATFAFERQHFPWRALAQAAAVGGASVALAYALARVREGSVVEALARRLSARELSALLVMAGGGATLAGALTREPPTPEYAFATDKVLRGERGAVEIAYLEDGLEPVAARLAADLEQKIAATASIVALPDAFPKVRLVNGPEVAPGRPRNVANDDRALVLRVRLEGMSPEDQTQLVSHVLHGLLWRRTRQRAGYEPKHWMLDGFALAVARSGEVAPPPTDLPDRDMLRAVVASAALVPFDERALAAWAITSERLGDVPAAALAASGWRVLGARVGPDKTRALVRAAFGRRGTGDVRDAIHDWRTPMPKLFERATGWPWADFLTAWREALAAWGRTAAGREALASWPRAALVARADARAGVGVGGTLGTPLAAPLTCALEHVKLPPFDAYVDPDSLEEVGFLWPRGATDLERVVSGTYGRGERALVALECDLPPLGGRARLFSERVTVR
jgi:hypothetical protein